MMKVLLGGGNYAMIQCKDCEFCEMGPDGQIQFKCNPFSNTKEPECLLKHQLLRLDMMTRAYMATIAEYKKIAPMQKELFRRMRREFEDMDEADKWKYGGEEKEEEEEEEEKEEKEEEEEEEEEEDGLPPLDDPL